MLALPLLLAPPITPVAAQPAFAIGVIDVADVRSPRDLPGPLALEMPRLGTTPAPRRAVSLVVPAVVALSHPGPSGGRVTRGADRERRAGHTLHGASRAPPRGVPEPAHTEAGR